VLIPVRCFTCGKVIGHIWKTYIKRVKAGESPEKVLNELGVNRYCCRRMLLSHVDLIEEVVVYGRKV